MASVCFLLHCSQLASNCGIKGAFVLRSLYNLDAALRRRHDVREMLLRGVLLPVRVNSSSSYPVLSSISRLPFSIKTFLSSLNLGPSLGGPILNTVPSKPSVGSLTSFDVSISSL